MDELHIINQVLMNHLILEKIFSHFSVSDLKSCRLVFLKWELICTPLLQKSSICCIRNTDSICRDISLFYKDFPDSTQFVFTKFLFEGEFSAEQLEFFFSSRSQIKELTFVQMKLVDKDGKRLYDYHISKWTAGLRHLESLRVDRNLFRYMKFRFRPTIFVVPLSCIGAIKRLFLRDAIVIWNGRIAPTNIECWHIDSKRSNAVWLPPNSFLDISEYMDVRNLKELKLFDTDYPKFHLDLAKCPRLEQFYLQGNVFTYHRLFLMISEPSLQNLCLHHSLNAPPRWTVLVILDCVKQTFLTDILVILESIPLSMLTQSKENSLFKIVTWFAAYAFCNF